MQFQVIMTTFLFIIYSENYSRNVYKISDTV